MRDSARHYQTSSFEKLNQKEIIHPIRNPQRQIPQNYVPEARRSIFPDVWKKTIGVPPQSPYENVNGLSDQKMTNFESVRKVHFSPTITVITVIELNNYNQDSKEEDCEDSRWYSEEELEKFKFDAACAVRRFQPKRYLHSSRTRENFSSQRRRAVYSNPALKVTDGDEVCSQGTQEFGDLLSNEVKNILIVEPNTTMEALYIRSFKLMFPHCSVLAINNVSEALDVFTDRRRMTEMNDFSRSSTVSTHETSQKQFDIIVVEERLRDTRHVRKTGFHERKSSEPRGSELLEKMTSLIAKDEGRTIGPDNDGLQGKSQIPLFIGTSLFLGQDGKKLVQAGADHIWGKAPPQFDDYFRNELLNSILRKRGKHIFCI